MNKVLKVIIILIMIIFFSFLIGFLIYSDDYYDYENYSQIGQPQIAVANDSCYNFTFNLEIDENLGDG